MGNGQYLPLLTLKENQRTRVKVRIRRNKITWHRL